MKATLDRIEGEMAVILVRNDESTRLNIPVVMLPEGSQEGDILDISITRDEKETEDSKARVSSMIERLKKKSQCNSGFIEAPEH
ncbi:MAG: DUF3006 domain-containing protein [Methanotrichaceae archaeon]